MEAATTLLFASAARVLADEARRRGLDVPGFRSPPRLEGVDRSLRRRVRGSAVAVRVAGRPWAAVVADMIEGIVVVNELRGAESDAARAALWEAIRAALPSPSVTDEARVA